ncbi:dihydroxyacetone kinase phosphoryl donor subunit DhaM [Thermohalobacter berrensis]|uniref:phosphoenolpyruvate--glycerone phosphotransferase n=1 Tax=Thermohalobacter berrensis TaxID=99594 RepID=A0A419T4S3_9FIRM|nr:dihydroxyacetone kinase phosphoryl donor subunit DhaM [Thermohalobacter berrensis]RKD32547.1 PTS-dependent dihydroxyacetone kinase phosphotransferase subunit DhaM [Thermohalobacter berrensis]
MVGIVIVSHSSKIAEGIVELSRQMVQSNVKIIPAGGTSDGRIGTDATKILEAIKKANDGDGVIVLADLGSAILSTEMAIDLLDEDIKNKVIIADAPVVEGSVAAAVEASLGSDLEKIKESAEESKRLIKINS